MAAFIQGIPLARAFYAECVEPLLGDLVHSAGIIGRGSEVLGFDTERSRDHHWGPRVMVFVDDLGTVPTVTTHLAESLPVEFNGYPTNFSAPDPADSGAQRLVPVTVGPVNHRVEFFDFAEFAAAQGVDIDAPEWLSISSQCLRGLVDGELFRDDLDLQPVRDRLAWYPDDVWRAIMASFWLRIGQDEHLCGRAAEVGDDLGSRLIAARLVRDVMRLAFLMERVYAPYPKWFGMAFARLACAPTLGSPLADALATEIWENRQRALCEAFEVLAEMHNVLGVGPELDTTVRPFHGRPFFVISPQRFVDQLLRGLSPALRLRAQFGPIDAISDNTDVLERPGLVSLQFGESTLPS